MNSSAPSFSQLFDFNQKTEIEFDDSTKVKSDDKTLEQCQKFFKDVTDYLFEQLTSDIQINKRCVSSDYIDYENEEYPIRYDITTPFNDQELDFDSTNPVIKERSLRQFMEEIVVIDVDFVPSLIDESYNCYRFFTAVTDPRELDDLISNHPFGDRDNISLSYLTGKIDDQNFFMIFKMNDNPQHCMTRTANTSITVIEKDFGGITKKIFLRMIPEDEDETAVNIKSLFFENQFGRLGYY